MFNNVKFLFASRGIYSTWERLGDVSSCADYLMKIKKALGLALGKYQGSSHTTPDTSSLVWKVANKVREAELDIFKLQREGNELMKPVTNIILEGERKLKSSTLKTFNKNVRKLVAGEAVDDEVDDMVPVAFGEPSYDDIRPEEDEGEDMGIWPDEEDE